MISRKMKKYIIILVAALFPLFLTAQVESRSDSIDNNVSTLLRQLSEKQQEIDGLNDSIKKLNAKLNATIKMSLDESQNSNLLIGHYQDTISQLRNENASLLNDIRLKNDSLRSSKDLLLSLDNIVYKECLLFPLERRFNAKYIEDSKRCLDAMGTSKTHPKEYETYYHFLGEYASFNQELINFLRDQDKRLEMKQWKVNELAISQAEVGLKDFAYYKYYLNRNKSPWESILYLDETIDEFFKLLKSGKLNSTTMQELIQRLKPKQ